MRRDVAKGLFAAPYAPGRSQGLFDESRSKRLSGTASRATVNVSHLSVAGQRYKIVGNFQSNADDREARRQIEVHFIVRQF